MAKSFFVCCVSILFLIAVEGQAFSEAPHVNGRENEREFARTLNPLMADLSAVGRVYYYVNCQKDEMNPAPFPEIVVDPTNHGEFGLAALRRALRENRGDIIVSENPVGIVRLSMGRYVRTILDVHVAELNFSPEEQYDYVRAIYAVLGSKEVQRAMRDRGILQRPISFVRAVVVPTAGAPHLPAKVENMTVDQIFDAVAQSFDGIFLYGACSAPLQFNIGFFSRSSWE